ncbi:hemolysin III family channel protein [Colletotrichum navitas]|uniref:Hemolysin III family channel protein n=1 Tax=Colletotrichum navitas TaxID=681940 RepID=A0AAD8V4E9_9PEZI|nr:hemolysin III family channel protein [Colletotrichum navitas]KAK1585639.1 hemolysin III family channel protein [Colletotrichum navitas]
MTASKPSADGAPGVVRNRNRRPSSSAATAEGLLSSVESTVAGLEKKVEEALLILWDDLPAWRRDNAFILTGYRPDSNSYLGSLRSLGYLHNESVNIWSHLLGAVAFLVAGAVLHGVVAPRYGAAAPTDVLVFACFFAGAVACLGMSATYHAISNHSPEVAKWGNKLDYSGIVFLIVGSYVPALYYGFYCHPGLMKFYLSMINLLGLGCGAVSWIEFFRAPEWRTFRACMFIALGTSGVVPVLHGAAIYGRAEMEARMSLSWVVLHGAMYIFGAFLYALRWPERSFPGTFDIWGSSHQIFHFFVVAAAATHLYGMAKAFDYNHSVRGSLCL